MTPELLVITGMSGAGRSTAAKALEDLGWYVVDNLPTSLVEKVVELASLPGTAGIDRLALVAGRDYVTPEDVKAVAKDILRHRLIVTYEAEAEGLTSDDIVDEHGDRWGISDCLVPIQGANYALSKSVQRWRALLTKEEGRFVSANVAPASHTRSVVKNKMLAAAYRGCAPYGVEIFDSKTIIALARLRGRVVASRGLTGALGEKDSGESPAGTPPETPPQERSSEEKLEETFKEFRSEVTRHSGLDQSAQQIVVTARRTGSEEPVAGPIEVLETAHV